MPRPWLFWLLGALSLASGFAEAGVLFLCVKIATALTAGESTTDLPFLGADTPIPQVLIAAAVLLGVVFVGTLTGAAASASLVTSTVRAARVATASAYLASTYAHQSRQSEGRLQHVLNGCVQRLGAAMMQFTAGLTATLGLVAYLLSAVIIDPAIALTVLLCVTGCALLLQPVNRRSERLAAATQTVTRSYIDEVNQTVRASREVAAFGVRGVMLGRLTAMARAAEKLQWSARLLNKLTPGLYRILVLGLLLLGLAAARTFEPERLADLGALVLLLVRGLAFGQQLASVIQQLADAAPYVSEVRDLHREFASEAEAHGPAHLGPVTSIHLRGVGVRYGRDQEEVVRGLDLQADAGQVIGIVGPSGGGKSTICQMLLRLRPASSGEYSVNGLQAGAFDAETWCKEVAFVPQDNIVITGTVADNIRFLRPGYTEEQVRKAATAAHLHEEIERLPSGYDTLLGPGERELSGGQRQRLGLARALLGTPSVLVLDEPTSALDMQSEELIRQTLQALQGEMIMFVVAHRMSTLQLCDRIHVVEAGRTTASGTHEELLASNVFYNEAARLTNRQSPSHSISETRA